MSLGDGTLPMASWISHRLRPQPVRWYNLRQWPPEGRRCYIRWETAHWLKGCNAAAPWRPFTADSSVGKRWRLPTRKYESFRRVKTVFLSVKAESEVEQYAEVTRDQFWQRPLCDVTWSHCSDTSSSETIFQAKLNLSVLQTWCHSRGSFPDFPPSPLNKDSTEFLRENSNMLIASSFPASILLKFEGCFYRPRI